MHEKLDSEAQEQDFDKTVLEILSILDSQPSQSLEVIFTDFIVLDMFHMNFRSLNWFFHKIPVNLTPILTYFR